MTESQIPVPARRSMLKAVAVGEVEIQEQQIRPVAGEHTERFLTRVGQRQYVAGVIGTGGEDESQAFHKNGMVISNDHREPFE